MRDRGTTRVRRWATCAALALGLGCGGGEGAAENSTTPARTYRCALQVSKRAAGEYTGKGEGADAAQAEAAAWTDVCAKLPETERASCRDETKWVATKSSASAGEGSLVTIQLAAVAPAFAGEASSEVSSAAACEAALAEACAQAGAPGDCLSAGYEKQNEEITRTTRVAGP